MTIDLTDTTTGAISNALTEARQRLGGMTLGMVLTLIIVTDEEGQYDAIRAANQAAESALALAEADRLVLPFAITGSRELLEALPRHETAHAALLTDILDVLHGASLTAEDQSLAPQTEQLSRTELRVLRYLPTNLSRPEIASELSVSVNTVNTHVRNIYAKLQASDRSSAVQRARELRLLSSGPLR